MNEILYMLEQNCSKSMKQLMIVYPLIFVVMLVSFTLLSSQTIVWMRVVLILSLLMIARIHYQRIKNLAEDGALTRIKLLPLKPYALVISELLFCVASFAFLFVCLYAAWFFYGYVILQLSQTTYIATTWTMESLDFLFSDSPYNICFMMLYILLLGMINLVYSLSKALHENVLSYFWIIYITYEFVFTMESLSFVSFCIYSLILVVLLIRSIYLLNQYLNFRRKKVNS